MFVILMLVTIMVYVTDVSAAVVVITFVVVVVIDVIAIIMIIHIPVMCALMTPRRLQHSNDEDQNRNYHDQLR